MVEIYLIIGIFLSISVSTFFSFSETAILSLNKSKLEFLINEGDKKAKLLKSIINEPEKILSPILLGNTLANVVTAFLTSILISRIFLKPILGITEEIAQVISTLLISILILIFGEITPKSIAARNPEKYAFSVSYVLNFVSKILMPFVKISIFFSSLIIRKFEKRDISKSEIKRDKILSLIYKLDMSDVSENSYDIMKNAVVLPDVKVKDIMTPRTDVIAVDINSSVDEILDVFLKSEYSRIPVFEGNIDNIVGILISKEFFRFYLNLKGIVHEAGVDSIENIISRPLFISEYSSLEMCLKKIRDRKSHFALVVDETGQFVGIVTLEDIIEEIVGEIYDEYDDHFQNIYKKSGNGFVFYKNINIKDFNRLFPFEIPESKNFTTLFGYIAEKLGDIPESGVIVEDENYLFKVKRTDKFEIKELEVMPKNRSLAKK